MEKAKRYATPEREGRGEEGGGVLGRPKSGNRGRGAVKKLLAVHKTRRLGKFNERGRRD